MAGRGKTGKVTNKSESKKQIRRESNALPNGHITNGSIRRLARRGGVRRISLDAHGSVREYIDIFLERVVRDSLTYA